MSDVESSFLFVKSLIGSFLFCHALIGLLRIKNGFSTGCSPGEFFSSSDF